MLVWHTSVAARATRLPVWLLSFVGIIGSSSNYRQKLKHVVVKQPLLCGVGVRYRSVVHACLKLAWASRSVQAVVSVGVRPVGGGTSNGVCPVSDVSRF